MRERLLQPQRSRGIVIKYAQITQTFFQGISKIPSKLVFIPVPAALPLGADPAKAILNINTFGDGPNLKVVSSGSLSELGTELEKVKCGANGALVSPLAVICTGIDTEASIYKISGPPGFGGTAFLFPAGSVSGPFFDLNAF